MTEAGVQLRCDLCDADCGASPIKHAIGGAERCFCCVGCQNVFTILVESGVAGSGEDYRNTELFRRSLELGLVSTRKAGKRPLPPGVPVTECVLSVAGMWCTACGWLIEHALNKENGVVSAEVLFASDLVRVKYSPQLLPPERITSRIESLGYRAAPYDPQRGEHDAVQRDLLLRIGIAFFLWMNVMLFSLPMYASYWEPIWDSARRVVPLILMGLATPAVFYSAWPILRAAWLGARHLTLRMETLLALGILAAYGYSSAQAILGGPHFYFDTACAIVTLVLLGKLMERGAKQKTAQAIALLHGLMPNKARVVDGERERFVSIEALQPGMTFLVKAGERIPADGVIEAGVVNVDESVLTGESAPSRRQPGDAVIGGSLAIDNAVKVRATRVSGDTALSHIIRSVEAAISNRSAMERMADRVTRIFVPVVMVVAAITVAANVAMGLAVGEAMLRGIAVLVIACPCALGVATPLAITAAVGAASQRGILVSGAEVLETARQIDTVVFDKTGTVTEGRFELLEADDEVLPYLAAVERYSEHPLGAAVVRRAEGRGTLPAATAVQVHKGLGVTGEVDGERLVTGNRALLSASGVSLAPELDAKAREWEATGATVAFWSYRDKTGLLAFGDVVKKEARELVEELRRRGIRTALISGDAHDTTHAIARLLGVDEFHAEVLPERKAELVRAFQQQGRTVAMVGDGVNDAPALAAANLGIALGTGADIAMSASPVVLMHPSLQRVLDVFDIAVRARRIVAQNLFWAFAYNVAGITLAATGVLNPILAAVAMVLSSVSVIANSRRLKNAV
jgi:heavy metal translocating P-type ATPase